MRDSIMMYRTQCEALKRLPPETFRAAVIAIWDYALDDETPGDLDPVAEALFLMARPLIDRNNRNFENGRKRSATEPGANRERTGSEVQPKRERTATETGANPDPKEKGERINIKENLSPNGERQKKSAARAAPPPTVQEVAAYIAARGYDLDAEAFVDYYASQKWRKANGQPLIDWRAGVRNWVRVDKQQRTDAAAKAAGSRRTDAAAKGNRFHNFEQRDVGEDYDKMIAGGWEPLAKYEEA